MDDLYREKYITIGTHNRERKIREESSDGKKFDNGTRSGDRSSSFGISTLAWKRQKG
jgi:hypothetical protein